MFGTLKTFSRLPGIGVKTLESIGKWGSARGLSISRALQACMTNLRRRVG